MQQAYASLSRQWSYNKGVTTAVKGIDMTTPQFDIVFKGQLIEGTSISDAVENMAKLFKSDTNTIEKRFFGKPCFIKKAIDETTAEKYQRALEKAGVIVYVRQQSASTDVSQSEDKDELTLAPQAGNLLNDEEMDNTPRQEIDTSHLKIEPNIGELLKPEERKPAVAPIPAPDFELVPLEH